MSAAPTARCQNCGRVRPADELDGAGWCKQCRAALVRRASAWAMGVGLVSALVVATFIGFYIEPTQFLIGWIALIVVFYWLVTKIVRRIAFDLIRARGVPPPNE